MTDGEPLPTAVPAPAASGGVGRIILLIVALAVISLAFMFLPLGDWLASFRGWVFDLGLLGALLYVVAYIVCSVLMIPGTALTLGAGGVFGYTYGLILTIIGSNLGALAAFLLARTVMQKRVELWSANSPRFVSINHAVSSNGFKVVFLLRLTPAVPFTLLNYLLGVTRVTLPRYAAATLLGMLPANMTFVYIGVLSANIAMQKEVGRTFWIAGAVATIAALVVISRIARRALQQAESTAPENRS
jgi:uncharacterized membrane protein YdjX (TVP38/TMEM64 family)